MNPAECPWACEKLFNYTQTCPGVTQTMCAQSFFFFEQPLTQCIVDCKTNNYNQYWCDFSSDFASLYSCFSLYDTDCRYWSIFERCTQQVNYNEIEVAFQALSFFCCVFLLFFLYKDIHKGLLQLCLFMACIHNLVQAVISE